MTDLFLVKLQVFTINDRERVIDGICFSLQAVTDLFLVKLQVFTINSNKGFCDRGCNEICL